jgi:hypothetical protein
MKKNLIFLVLMLLISSFDSYKSQIIEFYVAVDGNDNANGSLSKPFATLPKAVDAVRSIRKKGNSNPAPIYLRGGRHQLYQTLVLGIADGLTLPAEPTTQKEPGTAQLTFAAYPGENPVVSSGIPVMNWKLATADLVELPASAKGKVWVADMPAGMGRFYTLYDGKGRLNRARGKGFVPTKTGDKRTLYFPAGKLKNWNNLSDVEINIRAGRAWAINMLSLESVDEQNGVAKTAVTATYELGPLAGWVHTKDGSSAWIENTLDALDEHGEWVVDSKLGKIWLWPANPVADGSPEGILAPSASELIRVEGKIEYDGTTDKPVRGIAFSGITFTHGDRWAWTDDENRVGWGMQHDWDMFDRPTAALRFRGAEHCQVVNCKFVNSGGTGVRFDLHAQRNKVENCEFAHLGEAAILLAGYGPGTKDANKHNEIINNHIHHFSEITWHSPGIWAWQSGYNRIANNYIHHSGYAAVLLTTRVTPNVKKTGEGGMTIRYNDINPADLNREQDGYESWLAREKYNHSRHNLVEYNEITHSVQKLSDGNAIYVSGTGTGNIIRYNYIHDNLEHSFPSAIRCDDDQNGTLVFGNIIYNNYGFESQIASKGINDIINNFVIDPQCSPHWGYISFEWAPIKGSKAYHNIIISHPNGGKANCERPRRPGSPVPSDPKLVETEMESNLYYNPVDPNWMGDQFAKMRAVGKEQASLVGDPMFIDPKGGNFGFKEGSPALKLGIQSLDVTKMGLKK